jgi:hypothetical protein
LKKRFEYQQEVFETLQKIPVLTQLPEGLTVCEQVKYKFDEANRYNAEVTAAVLKSAKKVLGVTSETPQERRVWRTTSCQELRDAVKKRRKLQMLMNASNNSNEKTQLLLQIVQKRRKIKSLTRQEKTKYWDDIQGQINEKMYTNPKETWRLIGNIAKWKTRKPLGPINNENGDLIEGGDDYNKVWKSHFEKLGNETPDESLFDQEFFENWEETFDSNILDLFEKNRVGFGQFGDERKFHQAEHANL